MLGDHAGDDAALADQADGRQLVHDPDAAPFDVGVERVEQFRSTAPDVQREPAPERELAVDLVGLAAEAGLQLHALADHPLRSFAAAAHQNLAQLRIGAIFGDLEHVVEELLLGIGAEIATQSAALPAPTTSTSGRSFGRSTDAMAVPGSSN